MGICKFVMICCLESGVVAQLHDVPKLGCIHLFTPIVGQVTELIGREEPEFSGAACPVSPKSWSNPVYLDIMNIPGSVVMTSIL